MKKTIIIAAIMLLVAGTVSLDARTKKKATTKKANNSTQVIYTGDIANKVIGYNGTRMATYNVENMLEQLKRAYISRVTRNGCDDPRLYNQEMLRKLDADALAKFKNLHAIIGATKANHTSTDVDMAKSGLTNEQYEELERIQKKPKKERTPEELAALEEAKEKKKNADSAISILRGISIRLPLLMYGAELTTDEQEVTLENFASLIDDQSWEEFMPRGVTKELFAEFVPYYDPDMFRAVSRNYRDLVRAADQMAPLERTREIARIFSYFRNPDKETVLTPWRVVNMHIGDCIGGQVFFDTDMQTEGVKPRFVDHGEVTAKVFKDPNTRILEINSKTGLYPLFMAYSVFAEKLQAYRDSHMLATDVPVQTQNQIWDEVLRNNIFVICKTEMAKSITKRTLRGFRQAKVNARYFEDLINKITNQPDLFITKVKNGVNYWNNKELENVMKFNAIVGNPPYQITDGGGNGAAAMPIYNHFVVISKKIQPEYISMIMPARWYAGGRGLDSFRDEMLADDRLSIMYDYPNPKDCFENTNISGGVCYFLWNRTYHGLCNFTNVVNGRKVSAQRKLNEKDILIRYNESLAIIKKVEAVKEASLSSIISDYMPFGLRSYERGSNSRNKGDLVLYSSEGQGYIPPERVKDNIPLINKYKVIIGKALSGHLGEGDSTGAVKVLARVETIGKNTVCTESYICGGAFDTESEAKNLEGYLKTRFARFLLLQALSSMNITKDKFVFVPIQDFNRSWSDADLFSKYHLSQEEIQYINSVIKPMGNDTFFDSDDLLDPEFGDFNLIECGVSVGDKIVYTPTGTELIVAENNMVYCGEELYTLAQFTAEYMPRNKRSVSGVCQGPKYFSFNGTSLYKLRESFLGGQK